MLLLPSSTEDFKTIQLTHGQSTQVDAADYEAYQLWRLHWAAGYNKTSRTWYAFHAYKGRDGKVHRVRLSRLLLGLDSGDDRQPDHANHNGLDNRRSTGNLRIATRSDNCRNRRTRVDNASGYKGVSIDPRAGYKQFRAQIWVDGANIEIGRFYTPQEASLWYNIFSAICHGKFGCLNDLTV